MWTCTLALGLLLASQATAGVVRDGTVVLRRTVGDLGTKEGGDAANIESLDRRQATASTMQNYTSPSWNQDTEAACTAALESMNGAPENPSGLAACYNIPELDMSTGVFQGDVRLYAMGPPTGDFANLAGNPVNVSMQYNGAIVHNQTSTLAKRDDGTSLISWPRDAMWSRATVNEMATYNVKGVVNSDLLANMNSTSEEQSLVPTVGLTGMSANGTMFSTTLSSKNANFVNGVFSTTSKQTASGIKKAVVSSPIQTLVVASDAPFIVPGIYIMIFPIGGIITGVWTVFFVATVAYGTVGRIRWRDTHRRRVAAMAKGSVARI